MGVLCGLAIALRHLGYTVAHSAPGRATGNGAILVANRYSQRLQDAVQQGASALLIADENFSLSKGKMRLPAGAIVAREDSQWEGNWATSFSWLKKSGPFRALPGGPLLEMEYGDIMPEAVYAGLPAWVGGWTLAAIGLANAAGSLGSGWLSSRMPKRHLLAWIYFGRAVAIAAFILIPASPATAIIFGITIGLFWLSTVPPTSSLVMLMFGTKYMAMLYGFAFFSHQVGGFLGVLLGGILYEQFGSYDIVWWLSVALGVASALINLPIVEKPVERTQVQPA